jgi:hypothetical protein
LTASSTFYAKWGLVLAETGGPRVQLWIGFGTLFGSAALAISGYRRKRRAD